MSKNYASDLLINMTVESANWSGKTLEEFYDGMNCGEVFTVWGNAFVFFGFSSCRYVYFNINDYTRHEMSQDTARETIIESNSRRGYFVDSMGQHVMVDDSMINAYYQINSLTERVTRRDNDFRKLNKFLNEYAESQGMCSDYEDTLQKWNDEFSFYQLDGRERDYFVPVRIHGLGDFDLGPVTATSCNEAKASVENWGHDQVLQSILDRGYGLDLNITVAHRDPYMS